MRKLVVILASVALVACTSLSKNSSNFHEWIGRSASELVNQWGQPTSRMTMNNGNTEYRYHSIQHIKEPDRTTPNYVTVTGSGQVVTTPAEVIQGTTYSLECEVMFEVDTSDTIVVVYADGNDCEDKAKAALTSSQ